MRSFGISLHPVAEAIVNGSVESTPEGCAITALIHTDCESWLGWLLGAAPQPARSASMRWALAHCDGGVTWARRDQGGQWRLSSTAFELSPVVRSETLQQLRIFGPECEVLIWRDEQEFAGRLLEERVSDSTAADLEPYEERYVLLGDRVAEQRDGFTRLISAAGHEQAVPRELEGAFDAGVCPLRLVIRHFLRAEPNGAVRVVASRLADLEVIP